MWATRQRAACHHHFTHINTWVITELDKFEKRDGSRFMISETTNQQVRDCYPYWKAVTYMIPR